LEGSGKEQLQRQIKTADREIDDLVYRLYGISGKFSKIKNQVINDKKPEKVILGTSLPF